MSGHKPRMKIVVVGAGEVGRHLCLTLSEDRHDVTVIETAENIAEELEESQNVKVVEGNGASARILKEAGVGHCDFFLAMTSEDTTNLLASSLAKALGAKTTIARIHDQTYADNSLLNYQLHFGIDFLINPEALGAVALAKAIRNPGRVAVENFARGEVEVQQVQLSSRSRLSGKRLRDTHLPSGVRVGIISRKGVTQVPTANSELQAGDLLTLVGPPEALYEIRPKFEPHAQTDKHLRIVLFGGSETAIALVRLLKAPRFRVRLIESDRERCKQLAEEFPHITVIHGSATSLRLLEEEQVGSADFFVACTKDDEDNIMTSLQARKLGVKRVMLIFNKPDYEGVLDELRGTLGVELAVSPRQSTVAEVMRYLSKRRYQELASLPQDSGKIIEARVSPNSSVINTPLKDLQLPSGCVIIVLMHRFQAKVPGAEDKLLPEDRLVIIVQESQLSKLVDLLCPKS